MTPSYPIKLIPLGGLGEIGQNMLVVEYQEEIIIIDAGLIFPHSKLTNVDFGIPDTTYLENKKNNIKAILVTHGHEDHIGAIPHLLEKIQAPVYSSPLTTHLIKSKLRRTKTHNSSVVVFKEIEANTQIQIGPFEITCSKRNIETPRDNQEAIRAMSHANPARRNITHIGAAIRGRIT